MDVCFFESSTILCSLQAGGHGRLGDGANDDQVLPQSVLGGHVFVAIAAGEHHTCAMSAATSMWCWGEAPGNGQTTNINEPAEVGGGHTFVAVSAGEGYTCGLDVARDMWCFGAYCGSCWGFGRS